MIVELVGPPGAGKSTLAALLDLMMVDGDRRILSFGEYAALDHWIGEAATMKRSWLGRWWALAPVVAAHPRLALDLARLAWLHGRPVGRRIRKAQRVLAHVRFVEQLQAHFPDRVVVLHDGFAQCLWSLVIESDELHGLELLERIIRDYYRAVDPVFVALQIDDAGATSRVFGRVSKGRFNRDSDPNRRACFPEWLAVYRTIASLLPKDVVVRPLDAMPARDVVARQAWVVIQEISNRSVVRRLPSNVDALQDLEESVCLS